MDLDKGDRAFGAGLVKADLVWAGPVGAGLVLTDLTFAA